MVHAQAAVGHAVRDPAGVADNVFHLVLSVPALAIVILDMSRSLQAAKASKRRRAHP